MVPKCSRYMISGIAVAANRLADPRDGVQGGVSGGGRVGLATGFEQGQGGFEVAVFDGEQQRARGGALLRLEWIIHVRAGLERRHRAVDRGPRPRSHSRVILG